MKEDYNRRKVDFNHIHATSNVHFDIFFEILNISENQRVLDIGGGYGEILLEFKKDMFIQFFIMIYWITLLYN